MELFEYSLRAAPAGVVLAIVAAIRFRSGWPLLVAPLGGLMGGFLGRWAATKQVGFDFGSEFEGYDWVIVFASVGVLVEVVLGSAFAAKRWRPRPK